MTSKEGWDSRLASIAKHMADAFPGQVLRHSRPDTRFLGEEPRLVFGLHPSHQLGRQLGLFLLLIATSIVLGQIFFDQMHQSDITRVFLRWLSLCEQDVRVSRELHHDWFVLITVNDTLQIGQVGFAPLQEVMMLLHFDGVSFPIDRDRIVWHSVRHQGIQNFLVGTTMNLNLGLELVG